MTTAFDSLIFDMDGTLWDSTDSYVKCWNQALIKLGHPDIITRPILESVMGLDEKKLLGIIFPHYNTEQQTEIIDHIKIAQDELLEQLGGTLYDGVSEGLSALAPHYRIFMLSNCFANTIHQFLRITGLAKYIEGHICYGENPVPKAQNMNYLKEKYSLQNPIYVGDTNGDRTQAEQAQIPFVYMTYGFDKVDTYYQAFDSFGALTKWLLKDK